MWAEANCLQDLGAYAAVLRLLGEDLRAGDWKAAWGRVAEAEGTLRCPECASDERTNPWRVLALLREAKEHWREPQDPCHGSLRETLTRRLSRPGGTRPLLVSELRFTHMDHSEHFTHGEHAGKSIDWLVEQLACGAVGAADDAMVLDVVHFHGKYRSLNNRHAVALHRYGKECKCRARVWPLVPGLLLHAAARGDIVEKFREANSSISNGAVASSRPQRRSGSQARRPTRVNEHARVHISNIDFEVTDDELTEHLRGAGWCHDLVRVEIARRKNGKPNGHGWATFSTAECAAQLASTGLGPLRGRPLRLQVDSASLAAIPTCPFGQAEATGGRLRCKCCRVECCALADAHLITDRRFPGFARGRGWESSREEGYFCLAHKDKLLGCKLSPHPDHKKMPFKLLKVACGSCSADLGNVQTTEGMEEDWSSIFSDSIVHFKAADVVLELPDHPEWHVEVKKWKALRLHLGSQTLVRLSELTMGELHRLFATDLRNSGREVRLIQPLTQG